MKKNKFFEYICKMSQEKLKQSMIKNLERKNYDVVSGDGYVFAQGSFPVCLVAHMDTVHEKTPKSFVYSGGKVASPEGIGGDDRCGIYMILKIIEKHNCSVLFLEHDEIGCVGARKFTETALADQVQFNYMIELDRKGSKDAVFYDCDNPEFEKFITEDGDWKTAIGIFSDISKLAPYIGCAAVNFSCGYYNAHTKSEYVVLEEMEANIKKVCKLLERTTEEDKFEYIEADYVTKYNTWYGGYLGGFDGWNYKSNTNKNLAVYADDDDFYHDYTGFEHCYFITYMINNEESYQEYYAHSEYEALGMFFVDHPYLCYDDVLSIEDWGEDQYNI